MTNLEIIKASYQASEEGNIPGIIEAFADDGAWTEMEGFLYAGTYVGKAAILENVFQRIGADWDNFAAVPDEFYDAGDTIITIGYYSGTYKKTGKNMKARFAHVWKLKNGKIIHMEQLVNTLLVDRAVNPR